MVNACPSSRQRSSAYRAAAGQTGESQAGSAGPSESGDCGRGLPSLCPQTRRSPLRHLSCTILLSRYPCNQALLGVEQLRALSGGTALKTKRSYAPRAHAFRRTIRKAMVEAYAWFVAAFREAAEKLRSGDRMARFPEGSFPPGLPFVHGCLQAWLREDKRRDRRGDRQESSGRSSRLHERHSGEALNANLVHSSALFFLWQGEVI